MTDQEFIDLTKAALHQIEHDRIAHNMEILRTATPEILFRLRDAARVMESCGYVLDPLAESSLFDYAIRQRQRKGETTAIRQRQKE